VLQTQEASEQGRAGRLHARLTNVDKILINLDDVLTKL
jgi:hypothetical protein